MASHLVGLLGLKRSGKDTFAARLVEAHGFTRIAFADPLKEAALALDPIVVSANSWDPERRLSDVVEAEGWEAAKEVPEVRRTLQNLGVAIRGLDEDFWLRVAIRRARPPHPLIGPKKPSSATRGRGLFAYLRACAHLDRLESAVTDQSEQGARRYDNDQQETEDGPVLNQRDRLLSR
jgi:hypothetical protein